jgi:Family of unknown function (DUF6464)
MTYSKKSDCVNLDVNANVIELELDQELVEWIDEETPSMSIPAISFPFAPMQISSECMELLALNTLSKNNNTNCTYNTRSPHLKCTVHPSGSCDGCKDFKHVEDSLPPESTPILRRSSWFEQEGMEIRSGLIINNGLGLANPVKRFTARELDLKLLIDLHASHYDPISDRNPNTSNINN